MMRAVAQHRHAVGQRQRLLLVVGDEHRRHALRAQQRVHLLAHARAQRRRRARRTARRAAAPAGGGRARGRARRAAARRRRAGAGRRFASGAIPTISSSSATCLPRRSRRGSPKPTFCWTLRCGNSAPSCGHVADAAPLRREIRAAVLERLPAERHAAPLGALEAGDHAQQRRLAAAGQRRAPRSASRPRPRARRRAAPARRRSPSTARDRQPAHARALRARERAHAAAEQVRGDRRDGHHQGSVRRGRAVGEVRSCKPRTASRACSRRSGAASASRSARWRRR